MPVIPTSLLTLAQTRRPAEMVVGLDAGHCRDRQPGRDRRVAARVPRLRCDPAMMAELGGPLPREGIEAKVARDVASARAGDALIMVTEVEPGVPAGHVVLWTVTDEGPPYSEIGWMVLPEYQGRPRRRYGSCWPGPARRAGGALCGPTPE